MSEDATLNSGDSSTTEVTSTGFLDVGDGLVSAVDRAIPTIETQPVSEDGSTSGEDANAQPTPAEPGDVEKPPFHEHPRWKELMREKEVMARELAELRGALSVTKGPQGREEAAPQLDYSDMSTMTDDELVEMISGKPKQFLNNLFKQAYSEIRGAVLSELKSTKDRESQDNVLRDGYKRHSEQYPDFEEMWKSGEIESFLRDNPAHNAISAHLYLRGQKSEAEVQKKIEAAKKEAAEQAMANLRAKQGAKVLSGAPATGAGSASRRIPDELKNPEKYGGVNSVLAARLMARRNTASR